MTERAAQTQAKRFPPRILVVDDTPEIRELLQIHLEAAGYEILTASNGQEALAIVATHAPDLILLDVMMPELNGFQVCEALRRDPALETTPVVMLTAMENQKLNELAFEAGAEVCMTKPFQPDRLVNIINLALDNAARKRPVVKQVSK